MEFLGYAVLGLVVAEALFQAHPEWQEGELTRVRAQLVSRKHMAEVARNIELGSYLRLSKGEERGGLRSKSTVLSNSMEAVLGALFLDGGLEPVRRRRQNPPMQRQPVKAALELHIEQGPVLEQRSKTIGVVTGVQHMSRHEVTVMGREAHAGPTPMDTRRDPIRVLAEVLPLAYAAAHAVGADARLTVGVIETSPGSPNTVPGKLRFTLDVRHPDSVQYASLRTEIETREATEADRRRQSPQARADDRDFFQGLPPRQIHDDRL